MINDLGHNLTAVRFKKLYLFFRIPFIELHQNLRKQILCRNCRCRNCDQMFALTFSCFKSFLDLFLKIDHLSCVTVQFFPVIR